MVKKINITAIESDVPIPITPNYTKLLREMGVGDSFEFPLDKRDSVASIATKVGKDKEIAFTVRKMDETTGRIWRTE